MKYPNSPWKLETQSDNAYYSLIDDDGIIIHRLSTLNKPFAKLIRAAPELLEGLEELNKSLDHRLFNDMDRETLRELLRNSLLNLIEKTK